MRARLGVAVASLAMCVHYSTPVLGDDDWAVAWNEGLRFESKDDRFRLQLGGRIQADWSFGSESQAIEERFGELGDQSEIRRARLFVSGLLYDRVEFKIQYDFASGDAEAKDVYLGFLDTPAGDVRVGHFKEPFSLETLTSSKYIAFLERSLPAAFAPERNLGVMFHGSSDRYTWGAGAFRETDEFGKQLADSERNLTGRFVWRPLYREEDEGVRFVHVGLSATDKTSSELSSRLRLRPEVHIDTRLADTGSFLSDGQEIVDVELAGVLGPVWFAAEYMDTTIERSVGGELSFDGLYLQVGYFLTGERRGYRTSSGAFERTRPRHSFDAAGGPGAWEVALRYSTTDLSDREVGGGELASYTAALNWYANPVTRLMLNWVHPELDGTGDANLIAVRAQIDF